MGQQSRVGAAGTADGGAGSTWSQSTSGSVRPAGIHSALRAGKQEHRLQENSREAQSQWKEKGRGIVAARGKDASWVLVRVLPGRESLVPS